MRSYKQTMVASIDNAAQKLLSEIGKSANSIEAFGPRMSWLVQDQDKVGRVNWNRLTTLELMAVTELLQMAEITVRNQRQGPKLKTRHGLVPGDDVPVISE